jgi:long-chain fatty acid transport protein
MKKRICQAGLQLFIGMLLVGGQVQAVHASGFGIFTQGASALGQGAAVTAHGSGPSSIFYNPALLNGLPGTNLEVGTTLIFPDREFTSSATGMTDKTRDTVFFPSTFYLSHSFNETVTAGLGVFSPFGLGTTWSNDWEGRYLATKSEMTTFDINPVISLRVLPELSIAVGADLVYLNATLESKVPSFALAIPGPPFDVTQKFKGSGLGGGFNVGLLYTPVKPLSLGVSYRSQVKIDADGEVTYSVPSPALGAKTTIKLPQQLSAGLAYRPTDRLTLEVGTRWEDWASFPNLTLDIAGVGSAVYPRDWHGTWAVNFGGSYRLNDNISLLAGYLYGWNPVPDSTFEPAIPDSNAQLFCVGTDLTFGQLNVALSYAYQRLNDRSKQPNLYDQIVGMPIANGTYESSMNMVAVSLGYRF